MGHLVHSMSHEKHFPHAIIATPNELYGGKTNGISISSPASPSVVATYGRYVKTCWKGLAFAES